MGVALHVNDPHMQLLERDDELELLGRMLDEARASRGRMVLVEGQPGIGKTQLLDSARAAARDHGMRVLAARASELDRQFPFGVVRQLFEPLLAGADADRRAAWLHGAAARAAPLLGEGDPDAAGDDPLAHLHALYWLVANVAEESPLLLCLDDLQWADPSSLRFLQFVLPRLAELPVLVAGATRADEPGIDRAPIDALATDPLTLVLRPAPLTDTGVTELLESRLGAEVDGSFSDACRVATGGNPFLLGELLRELASEGVAPTSQRAPVVEQLAPPTVARAVLLRLARLGSEASALARAVAVLGDGVPLSRAATLAELTEEQADAVAGALTQAGILMAARPLSFAHPILRAAVYSDMDAGERARAHRRAADLLAGEGAADDEVAVHLLETEPAADPTIVTVLRRAAALARSHGAPAVAIACLSRALAEPPAAGERRGILLELASAELHGGRPGDAVAHFDEGLAGSVDPRVRANWVRQQSVALQALDRHDEAFAVRERAVAEVAPVDEQLALSLESGLVASAGLHLSRQKWARQRLERLERRRPLDVETPGSARLVAMRAYFEACYGTAGAGQVADSAERALESGGLVEGRDGMATTSFYAAVEVLWLADRVDDARAVLDRAVDDARRGGSEVSFACACGWRCRLLARIGALREAEADARSCAELSLPQGLFAFAPPMLGYVLSVLIERGAVDDAERVLEESGMAERPAGHDLSRYPMAHERARLRARRRDLEGARADFQAVARRGGRWNTDLMLIPPVLAAPELPDFPFDADAMLRQAESWGTPRATGMALHAAGRLEEAVAALERSPARIEYAHALVDLGASLRRANRRAAARDPLRQALDVADACGADPLAERARHELHAAGGRPRRPRISGVDSLTPSERRIADMAADGLSNPEIAQALFVTRKTVEAHLAGAYRKLDIRSRAELPAALRVSAG
jgi:DNA-binding CsgD family transcriptional regulator